MPIKNRLAEMAAEITGWRQDFHANPELLFDLPRTSAKVAGLLRDFGCDEVVEGIGRSGVVGLIKGKQDSKGRAIGLRADMDALPIMEKTGVDYASTSPGKMHACGHDGHTAMLLGAARYLAETRNFDGTVAVIFQPAEEGGGGARVMMDDGLFERFAVDEVYGMHNVPNLPAGAFAIRPGPFYGAADQFEIVITGRGGHAAQPHQTVDATVAGAHVVLALQSIVARNVDPVHQAVLSVTSLRTDSTAHNVIASEVRMIGTVRSFDPEVRDLIEARLTEVARHTARAHGCEAEVAYERGYPTVVNSPGETDHAAEAARAVSGGCEEAPMIMWGEDFAYFLEEKPGAYIWMGIGDGPMLHSDRYNFNDEVIPAGSSWFAEVAERRMPAA